MIISKEEAQVVTNQNIPRLKDLLLHWLVLNSKIVNFRLPRRS
jgi:hypothetical protein